MCFSVFKTKQLESLYGLHEVYRYDSEQYRQREPMISNGNREAMSRIVHSSFSAVCVFRDKLNDSDRRAEQ